MDHSLRDLSWIKAANVVTAWACQTNQISEARLKWKALEVKQNQKSFESLFIKVDLCLIRHGWNNWAKKKKCRRHFHLLCTGLFGSGCLCVLVKGLMKPGTALMRVYQQQPSTTHWPVCQPDPVSVFFFLCGEEEKISVPSSWADFISSHCPLNYLKTFFFFPSNTYTSHQWLCAQQSTSEVVLSSSWAQHESGLSFCDSALTLQSVLALAWFNSGLSEAHATWRLEIPHFFPLLRPNIRRT